MTTLQALAIAAGVSVALSVALCVVIYRPLQALLDRVCPGAEAVRFWARFSLTMLFLAPLLVSTVFGLPPAELMQRQDPGSLLKGIIATGLFGSFLTMLGMGLWVSALIRRAPRAPSAAPARDDDSWAARRP